MQPAAVQGVVFRILWLNLLVATAKAIYGASSGSLAVASDAAHSFLDAASNGVALFALRLAAHPPDADHPYGHRKIEIVAASLVGILIAVGSIRFAVSAVDALLHGPALLRVGAAGFVVMIGTLVVNVVVVSYEGRRGRELASPFLIADAAHTASDVLVTIGVIASLLAARLGVRWADPVAALVVIAVIAKVAWRILSANLGILLDRVVIDPNRVREVALAMSGVVGCHRVRSRGVHGAVHLDLHLQVRGDRSLRDAHKISHAVETALKSAFPGLVDVTIHVEPEEEPEEEL